ncbi:MAG: DUF4407 domain-containing protein [Bifidobacteriaceae bacterium]|jgi:hypothetical protein|nr:DUF4407 domain-containing protein [Bifidobacteriaceae bacterium]
MTTTHTPAPTPAQFPPQSAKPLVRALCRLGGMRSDLIDDLPQSRGGFINTAAAMLAVGVLATASMAYALKSTNVVPSGIVAGAVGLGWGVIIVVIDRVLITSMSRHPRGGWRNTLAASANFALRLCMALVIGAVVSMPLVLRVYEREIAAQVQVDMAEKRAQGAQKLDADFATIPELERQAAELDQQLNTLPFYDPAEVNPAYAGALAARDSAAAACETASAEAAAEAAGTGGTGRNGYGDEWRRLADVAAQRCAAAEEAEALFADVAAATKAKYEETAADTKGRAGGELDRVGEQLAALRADRAAEEAKLDAAVNDSDGLAARIEGLDHLAQEHRGVWWARLGLMAVLMLVEIMPVFSKFIRVLSVDDLPGDLERRRDRARLDDEDIHQAGRVKAVEIRAGIQEAAAQDWAAKQLGVEREVNTQAAAVDKDIQLERLDAWAAAERAKNARTVGAGSRSARRQ